MNNYNNNNNNIPVLDLAGPDNDKIIIKSNKDVICRSYVNNKNRRCLLEIEKSKKILASKIDLMFYLSFFNSFDITYEFFLLSSIIIYNIKKKFKSI